MSFTSSEINVVLTKNQALQNSQDKECSRGKETAFPSEIFTMTRTDGTDEPWPHCPSFHTKPWDSRHNPGVLAKARSTTEAKGNPLARPHYATAKSWGCNMTLFPASQSTLGLPVLASGAAIHFYHWPRLRTYRKPYRFKLSKGNVGCSWQGQALRAQMQFRVQGTGMSSSR